MVQPRFLDLLWPLVEREPQKRQSDIAQLIEALDDLYKHLDVTPDQTFLARNARFAELTAGSS